MKNFMSFLKDEDGQGMVEYALIIGLIAVVAIAVLIILGKKIRDKMNEVNQKLDQTEA